MKNYIFGYARVSTEQQNLDRQLDALRKYGCDVIYDEKMTGTKRDRPELAKMFDRMTEGDTVVIESLSRLGRSTKDLIELTELFEQKGVHLVSLKESIDTNTSTGKLLLRSKIALFATDPYISHAFRGQREGANCFNWDDLDYCNIFLRIPADKIEQWSGAVNLMYTQLIRHLERRPDMYSAEGVHNVQTLLLMDEFARFGKLEMITSALATLRSKNVNICLMIQSVAQLDKIYGEDDRRIIFDNCQYQAILRANDADTQRYLCDLIGTHISVQRSMSEHIDECWDTSGYSRQISEIRDLIVQPHELSTLDDVLLRTPYGFSRVKKFRLYDEEMKSMLLADSEVIRIEVAAVAPPEASGLPPIRCTATPIVKTIADNTKNNEGAKIMSIEERTANANRRIDTAERKRRQEERVAQEEQKRKDSRRSYIIGDLVAKYFPQVTTFEPGISAEGQAQFEPLEAFLYVLSTDHDLVEEFRKRAAQLTLDDPDGEWRISS